MSTLQRVAEIAATGVDLISIGELTHSVRAADISLKITSLTALHAGSVKRSLYRAPCRSIK